jgi:hypothetical protein
MPSPDWGGDPFECLKREDQEDDLGTIIMHGIILTCFEAARILR